MARWPFAITIETKDKVLLCVTSYASMVDSSATFLAKNKEAIALAERICNFLNSNQ